MWVWREPSSIVGFGIQSWKINMIAATCKYESNSKVLCAVWNRKVNQWNNAAKKRIKSGRSKSSKPEIYASTRWRKRSKQASLDCSISVIINVHKRPKSGRKLLLCRAKSVGGIQNSSSRDIVVYEAGPRLREYGCRIHATSGSPFAPFCTMTCG